MRKPLCLAVVASFVLALVAQPQQNVVPQNYQTLVANAAPANKAALLAKGILTVQDEAMAIQRDVVTLRAQAGQTFNNHAQQIQTLQQGGTDQEQRIKTLEQGVTPIVQHIQAIEGQNLKAQLDAIQKQLSDFRTATCPLLKNAKLKDTEKAQVDKVCQTVAAETK